MSARKVFSLAAVVLWCVALFLPCCDNGEPGYVGIQYAIIAVPMLLGVPPLMTNFAVFWAAVEAAAGREVLTSDGAKWVTGVTLLSVALTLLTLFGSFDWGGFVWLGSAVLACVSLLTGCRVTWRELDGSDADAPPLRAAAGQDFGTTNT